MRTGYDTIDELSIPVSMGLKKVFDSAELLNYSNIHLHVDNGNILVDARMLLLLCQNGKCLGLRCLLSRSGNETVESNRLATLITLARWPSNEELQNTRVATLFIDESQEIRRLTG